MAKQKEKLQFTGVRKILFKETMNISIYPSVQERVATLRDKKCPIH